MRTSGSGEARPAPSRTGADSIDQPVAGRAALFMSLTGSLSASLEYSVARPARRPELSTDVSLPASRRPHGKPVWVTKRVV